MDAGFTKSLVIGLVLLIYLQALISPRITAFQAFTTLAYLLIGFRLGYDTLMYRWLIEDDRLDHYGAVWSALENLYRMTGVWWAIHASVLAFVAWSLVALARRTPWPSLALAMMTTLPGMGFDYLSLLRQALATGMIIGFHLLAQRRSWAWATLPALAAFLTHPASAFAVAVLLLVYFRHDAKRLLLTCGLIISAIASVALLAPGFFANQVANIGFLFVRYLLAEDSGEPETGAKLAVFWAVLLLGPLLLRAAARPRFVFDPTFLTTTAFVVTYVILSAVSGMAVRLLWLLLPLAIALPLGTLVRSDPPYLISLCRGLFITASLAASIYVVQIAPEHYWAGDYPHEVHFAAP
ncbi:MAG: hypothetical protein HC793_00185 [Aquincola sp.]|nr:hypothetical protein [Aquincola sp.]